ncbi:hypothetical protein D9613_006641 [Agrocybe pediades]|uniref:Aquaporin n=1 Tax=Agrocybe pediades TaxID=84607 RepID=A0A8H4VIQ9_9AGAR|nr:hypothetical protein D9613_006641 [Agrocybe pediades]
MAVPVGQGYDEKHWQYPASQCTSTSSRDYPPPPETLRGPSPLPSSPLPRPPVSRGPSTNLIHTGQIPQQQQVPMFPGQKVEYITQPVMVPPDYRVGRLWRARSWFWEYAGEFFGVMMLVMFGSAANCQYNLSSDTRISPSPAGTWASLSLGWATGISLGVLLTGGHINPAVTLAMAVWRGFPWRKVPFYILAQLLGGIVGAAIVYGNYLDAIDIYEGGRHIRTLKTAGFFGTVPLDYLSNMTCFWDEFIGTALLLFGLLALLDKRNGLSPGLVAIGFFFVFVGIAACFGMQTGFAVNPARDLGPRIFTSMVGYGVQVYNLRKQYWLWSPVFATIMGAQFGTMMFDIFLDTGDQSIVTKFMQKAYHGRHRGGQIVNQTVPSVA